MSNEHILGLTAQITSAYVSHNHINPSEIGGLIGEIHDKLTLLADGAKSPAFRSVKHVDPKSTYNDDHIICLEDNKPVKLLKRYVEGNFDMTIEDYLAKWGLPADYPLVAKSYSEKRSQIAKDQGLGKNPTNE